jgi:agmatinase
MSTSNFDPNGVGIANGNLFGFPYSIEEAELIIIPVPWDATASFGKGTSNGPQQVLDASPQLDFYHPRLQDAYKSKIAMLPIDENWKKRNDVFCAMAMEYIEFLESGGKLEESTEFQAFLQEINDAHRELADWVKQTAATYISQGKFVALLGGEHSTPLGLIEALAQKHEFGILQLDAHADLRDAYEGFSQSHASIMFNAIQIPQVTHLVQVGIRDVAQSEVDLIAENDKITTFFDWDLKNAEFEGQTWSDQVKEIIAVLPSKVYVSFDIDALRPELCPNTGTPVPGGFSLEQMNYLLFALAASGKTIIGFDLNEVGDDPWDANVGARALWNLCCSATLSKLTATNK